MPILENPGLANLKIKPLSGDKLKPIPDIADKTRIAVLPFVNMSTNMENEYFSDGITEEIINALAKIDELKVTSRTSAFHFKGKNIPITEIGKELGVSTLLEGSVRLSGKAIRITAQLIDAEEDFHFWSETWDRQLDNIFEVQDEISLLIAEKLREQIGHFEIEEQTDHQQTDVSAYECYLRSKSSFAKFQKADLFTALEEIENAIAIDPECPFYHASQAIYYGYLGLINAIPGKEAFTKSREAALRALQSDPKDPEANYAIGMVHYFFEKDLDTAVSYLEIALKNRPNYVNALLGGSVMDIISGHHERSLSRIRKAMELDPLTSSHRYYLASALQRMGQYEEALEEVNKLLAVSPYHANAYGLKGTILLRLQRYNEAILHYRTFPVSPKKTAEYEAGIGIVYAAAGEADKALEYLNRCQSRPENFHLAAEENPLVMIPIYLGNLDQAFAELEKDIAAGKYYLNFYHEIPAFRRLSEDPRSAMLKTIFKSEGRSQEETTSEQVNPAKKALLDEEQIQFHGQQLLELMDREKPFLDENLSLKSLAHPLNLSPNQLSLVLNEGLGKNFNSFVNQYRVEEFKRIAKDPINANFTIVGLAYECGFNSKTVFNTYFKQHTGQTPREFLKN